MKKSQTEKPKRILKFHVGEKVRHVFTAIPVVITNIDCQGSMNGYRIQSPRHNFHAAEMELVPIGHRRIA